MSSPDTDPRSPTGSPGAGQQVTAAPIAGGYSPAYRALDTLSIGAFLALCAALVDVVGERTWLHVLFGFAGPLVADLVTGMVHWAADTWGTVRWPVVGPLFIRTFREHHVDPMAITRHDFVETNGSNAMVTLPLLAAAAWLGSPSLAAAVLWLCLWVMATNQLHKWGPLRPCVAALGVLAPAPRARAHPGAPRRPPPRSVPAELLHHRRLAEPAAGPARLLSLAGA